MSAAAPMPGTGAPRILVVDDDAGSRRVVLRGLEPLGVEVTELERADDIVAVARALQPDLVLLDLMMPGVDGHTACRWLRADPQLRDVPIVMITAYAEQEAMLAAFEAGVDDFLPRPVRRAELQARTRAILRLARHRRMRAARQLSRDLLTQVPGAAVVLDAAGHVLAQNPAARGLLGTEADVTARLAPMARAAFTAALGTVVTGGGTASCDLVLLGEPPRTVAASLGALAWDGEPAVVAFLVDVSAQRGIEDTWRRDERAAQLAVISAGLLHDLASLVQVALFQQRLLTEAAARGTAPGQELPRDLGDALQRMTALVTDLREVARDRLAPGGPARCEADQVVARVLRRASYLLPVSVRLQADEVPAHAVALPATVLEDALLNLLTNARDAVAEQGGHLRVWGEVDGDGLALHVEDDGPGIPPPLLARVGHPFVTTKPPGKGTGLGLWMVRTQVEAAGGRFTLGPGPAGGTRATLTLPLAG